MNIQVKNKKEKNEGKSKIPSIHSDSDNVVVSPSEDLGIHYGDERRGVKARSGMNVCVIYQYNSNMGWRPNLRVTKIFFWLSTLIVQERGKRRSQTSSEVRRDEGASGVCLGTAFTSSVGSGNGGSVISLKSIGTSADAAAAVGTDSFEIDAPDVVAE